MDRSLFLFDRITAEPTYNDIGLYNTSPIVRNSVEPINSSVNELANSMAQSPSWQPNG
jgi:hypothetical protein